MREKILVIQTNPKMLEGQEKLFRCKYDVHVANDNVEVKENCRGGRHSAVVIVIEEASDRELTLLREIKAQDGLDRPIIVITNHNSIDIEREIAAIGVFYHLLSPYEQNDLDDLIAAALRSWNSKSLAPKPSAQKGREVDK
jgi:DNA-binding NtrC family response regulator